MYIYIYAAGLSQVIPVFPYIPSLWMAAAPSSFSFAALVEEYCCYARGKCRLNGYDIDVGMTYQWGMVSIKHGSSNIPRGCSPRRVSQFRDSVFHELRTTFCRFHSFQGHGGLLSSLLRLWTCPVVASSESLWKCLGSWSWWTLFLHIAQVACLLPCLLHPGGLSKGIVALRAAGLTGANIAGVE